MTSGKILSAPTQPSIVRQRGKSWRAASRAYRIALTLMAARVIRIGSSVSFQFLQILSNSRGLQVIQITYGTLPVTACLAIPTALASTRALVRRPWGAEASLMLSS